MTDRKTITVGVPVTPTQRDVMRAAADAQGMSLAAWLRRAGLYQAASEARAELPKEGAQ